VLSVRLSLELSECKVCLPCELILEWIKLYKVCQKPWHLSGSPVIVFAPLTSCGVVRTLCWGGVETLFLGGEAPYGDDIEVAKGAWRAFVSSQVVLLGETW
jgi:hypothetical protein